MDGTTSNTQCYICKKGELVNNCNETDHHVIDSHCETGIRGRLREINFMQTYLVFTQDVQNLVIKDTCVEIEFMMGSQKIPFWNLSKMGFIFGTINISY